MKDDEQEPPRVRPDRYFEPVNTDEAEQFHHYGEGALAAFNANVEHGIPPYIVVGGTMLALASFLAATLPPQGPDDIFDGMVSTFGRMVDRAKQARAMQEAEGETRQ